MLQPRWPEHEVARPAAHGARVVVAVQGEAHTRESYAEQEQDPKACLGPWLLVSSGVVFEPCATYQSGQSQVFSVAASGGGSRQTRWKGLAHSAEAQTSMPSPAAPHTLHRSRVHSSRLAAGGAAGLGGFEIEAEVEIVAEVEVEVEVVVAAAVAALVASLGVALGAGLGAVVSWVASVSIRSSSPNSPRHTAHLLGR